MLKTLAAASPTKLGQPEQDCATSGTAQGQAQLHLRQPLPMIKRALLGLAERAGYSILKNADRERLDRQAAELAGMIERAARAEARLADLQGQISQANTEFAQLAQLKHENKALRDRLVKALDENRSLNTLTGNLVPPSEPS